MLPGGFFMASALIVYGSTTGNTRYMAEVIGEVLNLECSADSKITLLDAALAVPAGLGDGYDLLIFGCSTWGSDTIEFQKDFESLFENFDQINFKGKLTAVFGPGDSGHTYFCGAVNEIYRRMRELGATAIGGKLMIDGDPHMQRKTIEDWAKGIVSTLKGETWKSDPNSADGDQFVMHDKELRNRQKEWSEMVKAGQNVRLGDGESTPPDSMDKYSRGVDPDTKEMVKEDGQATVRKKKQPRT